MRFRSSVSVATALTVALAAGTLARAGWTSSATASGLTVQTTDVTAPGTAAAAEDDCSAFRNWSAAVTWSAAPRATGYTVWRATRSGGPYTQVGTTTGATAYTDTSGLSFSRSSRSRTTYYYVVTTSWQSWTSGWSPEAGVAAPTSFCR